MSYLYHFNLISIFLDIIIISFDLIFTFIFVVILMLS